MTKRFRKDNHTAIHLWEWLQADEISILINNGLSEGSSHCRDWEGSQKTLESTYAKASKDAVAITEEKLKAGKSALEAYIQVAVEREISNHFPYVVSCCIRIITQRFEAECPRQPPCISILSIQKHV